MTGGMGLTRLPKALPLTPYNDEIPLYMLLSLR